MRMNELESETVTYRGRDYRVWNLADNGCDVIVGEIGLEKAILGEDCDPVDEDGRKIDEGIGYYAEPTEEVEDVIRGYLG